MIVNMKQIKVGDLVSWHMTLTNNYRFIGVVTKNDIKKESVWIYWFSRRADDGLDKILDWKWRDISYKIELFNP